VEDCWPGNVWGVLVEGLAPNCEEGPVVESGESVAVALCR